MKRIPRKIKKKIKKAVINQYNERNNVFVFDINGMLVEVYRTKVRNLNKLPTLKMNVKIYYNSYLKFKNKDRLYCSVNGLLHEPNWFDAMFNNILSLDCDFNILTEYCKGYDVSLESFSKEVNGSCSLTGRAMSHDEFEEFYLEKVENGWMPEYVKDQSCTCWISNPPCSVCEWDCEFSKEEFIEEFNIKIV